MLKIKKLPHAPPIERAQEYICWFIEHSEKIAHLRNLYKKNRVNFVSVYGKGATKFIGEFSCGDRLYEHVGDLSLTYITQMKPMVEKRGGLVRCPADVKNDVISAIINIHIGMEFLAKKYRYEAVTRSPLN